MRVFIDSKQVWLKVNDRPLQLKIQAGNRRILDRDISIMIPSTFKSQHSLSFLIMEGINNAILQVPVGYEVLIIIVIIVVLFFGVKKIPELARSFGKATAEYEKARIEAKKELAQIKGNDKIGREKLEEIAETLGIDYTNKNDDELKSAIEGAVNKEKSN